MIEHHRRAFKCTVGVNGHNWFVLCMPEKEPELIKDPESTLGGPGIAQKILKSNPESFHL